MRFTTIASALITVGFACAGPTAGRPYSPPSTSPSGGDNNGNQGGSNTGNICPSDKPQQQCCQTSGEGEGILPINLGDLFCNFNALSIGAGNCNADVYCCQDNSVPSSGIVRAFLPSSPLARLTEAQSLINLDVSCIKLF